MKVMFELANTTDRQEYVFFCPGCRGYHSFITSRGDGGPLWKWNGSLELPTFSPSLLVRPGTNYQCHLFVKNGQIEYLGDCYHDLKGTVVAMIEVEE